MIIEKLFIIVHFMLNELRRLSAVERHLLNKIPSRITKNITASMSEMTNGIRYVSSDFVSGFNSKTTIT